jgi:transposase-like protein
VATAKNGISSVELGRRLGIKQTNAWALKQKIMAVMAAREDEKPLMGRVEMDDAYLGGHRRGKRGRGAAGKQPFVAAVSTSDERRPRKMKLLPVKGFRKKVVKTLVERHLASDARAVTDGLGCWRGIDEADREHRAIRTGSGKAAAQGSAFKWVNTVLGNIKTAITGTPDQVRGRLYRQLGPKHTGRSLASFAPPRPAGRVPFRDRIDGLLTIDGASTAATNSTASSPVSSMPQQGQPRCPITCSSAADFEG